MRYIGLDVHKDNITACVLTSTGKPKFEKDFIPTLTLMPDNRPSFRWDCPLCACASLVPTYGNECSEGVERGLICP